MFTLAGVRIRTCFLRRLVGATVVSYTCHHLNRGQPDQIFTDDYSGGWR